MTKAEIKFHAEQHWQAANSQWPGRFQRSAFIAQATEDIASGDAWLFPAPTQLELF